jgi:hypothetical protein
MLSSMEDTKMRILTRLIRQSLLPCLLSIGQIFLGTGFLASFYERQTVAFHSKVSQLYPINNHFTIYVCGTNMYVLGYSDCLSGSP